VPAFLRSSFKVLTAFLKFLIFSISAAIAVAKIDAAKPPPGANAPPIPPAKPPKIELKPPAPNNAGKPPPINALPTPPLTLPIAPPCIAKGPLGEALLPKPIFSTRVKGVAGPICPPLTPKGKSLNTAAVAC